MLYKPGYHWEWYYLSPDGFDTDQSLDDLRPTIGLKFENGHFSVISNIDSQTKDPAEQEGDDANRRPSSSDEVISISITFRHWRYNYDAYDISDKNACRAINTYVTYQGSHLFPLLMPKIGKNEKYIFLGNISRFLNKNGANPFTYQGFGESTPFSQFETLS